MPIGSCTCGWNCVQVAFIDQHAGLAHAGGEAPRQPAAIERFGAVLRDLLQRAREVRLADQCCERRHADVQAARNTARERASAASTARTSPAKWR